MSEQDKSFTLETAVFVTLLIFDAEYAEMKKQTSNFHNVFYQEKKVCNRGRVRYLMDEAYRNAAKFPVTEDFASAVCALPENYDESAYFNFIENWGTVSAPCLFSDLVQSLILVLPRCWAGFFSCQNVLEP